MLRGVSKVLPALLVAILVAASPGCGDSDDGDQQQPGAVPSSVPAIPPAPNPVIPNLAPPIGSSGMPGDCGTFAVCGWTPGWQCYNNHRGRSSCCWNAGDPSCRGSGGSGCNYACRSGSPGYNCFSNTCGWSWCSQCGGSNMPSDCGTTTVCGWTPGWRCFNNHQNRPACCWNAGDLSCQGQG